MSFKPQRQCSRVSQLQTDVTGGCDQGSSGGTPFAKHARLRSSWYCGAQVVLHSCAEEETSIGFCEPRQQTSCVDGLLPPTTRWAARSTLPARDAIAQPLPGVSGRPLESGLHAPGCRQPSRQSRSGRRFHARHRVEPPLRREHHRRRRRIGLQPSGWEDRSSSNQLNVDLLPLWWKNQAFPL